MTQSGSLMNDLYARGTRGQPAPEVGMGATILLWSDRHAATIVEVFEKGKYVYIGVQRDNAKRTDNNGMSDCQDYEYSPNTEASVQYFRFDGQFWEGVRKNPDTGRFKKNGGKIRIGDRREYHDFSF